MGFPLLLTTSSATIPRAGGPLQPIFPTGREVRLSVANSQSTKHSETSTWDPADAQTPMIGFPVSGRVAGATASARAGSDQVSLRIVALIVTLRQALAPMPALM